MASPLNPYSDEAPRILWAHTYCSWRLWGCGIDPSLGFSAADRAAIASEASVTKMSMRASRSSSELMPVLSWPEVESTSRVTDLGQFELRDRGRQPFGELGHVFDGYSGSVR